MTDKVIASIRKHNMLECGSVVVAAVSGGSDSMAMLHILNEIKDEFGFELIAAHVNHCLRGERADADEALTASECGKLGVELKTLRVDVAEKAKALGLGFEECGRKIRYEFFESLGENIVVATAHNLNDRAETFLFNFARGSTLRGLCSIPAKRENVIRPLIDCGKEEIIAFCKERGIPFAEDATNSDVHYARNRIRHNVIPELKEINSAFEKSAARCIESLNEDDKLLSSLALELVEKARCQAGYSASVLDEAPASLKKRAVVYIAEKEAGITPESEAVNRISDLLKNGGSCVINGAVTVRVRKGILDFPKEKSEVLEKTELVFGETYFGGATIKADVSETNSSQLFLKQSTDYRLDYDKISGGPVLRSREAGDRITLKSRGCTKTLKKLFNELAIPPEKRNEVIIFADDRGLLLAEGIGIDARAAVTKDTKRILHISIERN